jgi:hypothetical protein
VDEFEWDPQKANANLQKHRISFVDAVSVFEDEWALTIEDNSLEELRLITIGSDAFGRILVVVYTYRGEAVRIISARRATPNERRQYEYDK